MTTFVEHRTMQYGITDAAKHGFLIASGHDGYTDVLLDESIWQGAVPRVCIYRAPSVEEALTFIRGAWWTVQWNMIARTAQKGE